MERTGPTREHVRLSLQLILQAHLHQLNDGLTYQKVIEICVFINMRDIPETHAARLEALQIAAAQVLPLLD
ncbi:hypothetical protein CSZ94_26885 [Janthinobacterium sp. ROICE36]|uniref:hypothetical protein n=1 Tax=Janthinobacterium sp. ROICE36 TaxID=2048670 RepID=UPI000C7F4C55|nr:hypothetical protein [Janthinobacterium sp. ROICE36]PLY39354.1 hypothetical protein CSZ94_26885 [Janthinobacterium sp. ROICE36]